MQRIKLDRSIPPYEQFIELPYYDIEHVEKELGPERFQKLMSAVSEVVSCGHRVDTKGFEIHAIHAADLESFLYQEKIHLVEAK